MSRYQVKIDGEILPKSFTLDELIDAGLLDYYDTNIKVCATNETTWRVAQEYPFNLYIDEYGRVVRTGINNRNASRLELSTDSLHFTCSSGSRSIVVTAGGEWSISLSAASWVHLTKSGSNLTVKVDQNYGPDNRTDYFKLKSGNVEKRVDIYQSSSSPEIQKKPHSGGDYDGCAWFIWIAIGLGVLAAIFS